MVLILEGTPESYLGRYLPVIHDSIIITWYRKYIRPPPQLRSQRSTSNVVLHHASCRVAPEAETAVLTVENAKEDVTKRSLYVKGVERMVMIVSFQRLLLLRILSSLSWQDQITI